MGRPGKIPERWEDYSKIGRRIATKSIKTPFIAFKVPLKPNITKELPQECQFAPDQLVADLDEIGLRLGLIIDLTFTTRYYDFQYFINSGIQYEKIPVEGQMVPRAARFKRFVEVVQNFLSDDRNKDTVIGVHCTHGVNRTGYMLCKQLSDILCIESVTFIYDGIGEEHERYMVDHLGIPADDAIAMFNECRGHEIERPAYIAHLRNGELPIEEEKTYNQDEYQAKHWTNKTTTVAQRHHNDRDRSYVRDECDINLNGYHHNSDRSVRADNYPSYNRRSRFSSQHETRRETYSEADQRSNWRDHRHQPAQGHHQAYNIRGNFTPEYQYTYYNGYTAEGYGSYRQRQYQSSHNYSRNDFHNKKYKGLNDPYNRVPERPKYHQKSKKDQS